MLAVVITIRSGSESGEGEGVNILNEMVFWNVNGFNGFIAIVVVSGIVLYLFVFVGFIMK